MESNFGIWPYAPGDFWKDQHCNWFGYTPNEILANLSLHYVEEHADGTISVLPTPNSSNSILVSAGRTGPSWHGWIRRGNWEEC